MFYLELGRERYMKNPEMVMVIGGISLVFPRKWCLKSKPLRMKFKNRTSTRSLPFCVIPKCRVVSSMGILKGKTE